MMNIHCLYVVDYDYPQYRPDYYDYYYNAYEPQHDEYAMYGASMPYRGRGGRGTPPAMHRGGIATADVCLSVYLLLASACCASYCKLKFQNSIWDFGRRIYLFILLVRKPDV